MNKRCGNCGKYPFCTITNGANFYCDNWIKRNVEVKKCTSKEWDSCGVEKMGCKGCHYNESI